MFHLQVQKIEQVCVFELFWGNGQRLRNQLIFPSSLSSLYQAWRQAYLNFYQTIDLPFQPPTNYDALRGIPLSSGSVVSPATNPQGRLVEVEAQLVYEFHCWLRQGELYDIRAKLAEASHIEPGDRQTIDLFLTCSPIELARLPWEAWEIEAEFGKAQPGTARFGTAKIRIARAPDNISAASTLRNNRVRRQPRVLTILGDETGLNFESDRKAVRSLSQLATIQFVGWQPGKSADQLKSEIIAAMTDSRGWDVLFFAGHSNETTLTGGEIAVAPGVSLHMRELAASLTIAKERGLQFALFNSCSGLKIAEKLIDLGLSQVAVMREPIHNRVAEEFLVQFMQALADQKDVHEALILACQYLKLDKSLTYPSAYLVPSIFRRPGTQPFRIQPPLRQRLLPRLHEVILLSALLVMSGSTRVQGWLNEYRLLYQAFYRNALSQTATDTYPVLMVQIDEESLAKGNVRQRYPIDRQYLAKIVDKLSQLGARVVGIDYLLDQYDPQQPGDRQLAQSLQSAVNHGVHFVLAATKDPPDSAQFSYAAPQFSGADRTPGDILFYTYGNSSTYYIPIQPHDSHQPNSFSYQLAHLYQQKINPSSHIHPQFYPSSITRLGYILGQMWLHPIIDFSLPPNRIYTRIPAWRLLQSDLNAPELRFINAQAVMIVPSGYQEAGIQKGKDNLPLPAVMRFWRSQEIPPDIRPQLTGSEFHAYLFEHYLTQHLVTPIPDLWMILLAVVVGKATALLVQLHSPHRKTALLLLISGTGLYGLFSLQFYISAAVLLPIALPVATFWIYVLPPIVQRN